MRRCGRHAASAGTAGRRRERRGLCIASAAGAIVLAVAALMVLSPAGTAADAGVKALTGSAPPRSASFAGTPAVGVLLQGGPQGSHFCTASVVASPARNLVVTAAHCVSGFTASPGSIAFAPGYHGGRAPYGVWTVTQIFTTQKWRSGSDPDDDVAFLTVQGPVQAYTGAERLGAPPAADGAAPSGEVRVIGYPDGAGDPVTCQNGVRMLSAAQMEFDCGGYPDGTSGGPFLTGVSALTGTGTIVGVIGGYQQGGDTPDVSYSPVFGPDVQALYQSVMEAG